MKVPHGEGLATHTGPESCADARKGIREALTGDVQAGLLSRERFLTSGCRRCIWVRKATSVVSLLRDATGPCVVGDPAHVQKPLAREPGGPVFGPRKWC